MKKVLFPIWAGVVFATIGFAQAQSPGASQPQTQPQLLGRGRGGAPFAWNDKNKDGICDLTGKPIGQGRPIAYGLRGRMGRGPCGSGLARGFGRGRGLAGAGWGRGAGRGFMYWQQQQSVAPAQPPK